MDRVPAQIFHCPHCGAPGRVSMGEALYSCLCRFASTARASKTVTHCKDGCIGWDTGIHHHDCPAR
jgi:hypothetical protein